MKETTSSSMPPCFNRWCQKFDPLLRTKAQKREFRNYLGGLLGESKRKNLRIKILNTSELLPKIEMFYYLEKINYFHNKE